MKFSKNSTLFLLGLAGSVAADWENWSDAGSSTPVDPASKTWAPKSSPVDATSTSKKHKPAETVTVWGSTETAVVVKTTVYKTVLAGGSTCGCVAPTSVKPTLTGWAPGSSASGPAGWAPGSNDDGSDVAGADGGWGGDGGDDDLDASISGGHIIATGDSVYTWTGVAPTKPAATEAAPTYSGWEDNNDGNGSGDNGGGPDPGTDASNVTKPFEPLDDGWCNTAGDRSKWCGGYSTSTDYYKDGPETGKICAYDWVITNTTLDYDGVPRLALAVNGQVPGPIIECNWGDTIQVSVTNKMKNNATSIHWHGIIQKGTNDQDGVPGITECGIAPGDTRVYTFKASQYGTGWYHSHALAQLGDGIRGPMVIHGPATANYDIDSGTVMIDDLFGNGTDVVTAAAMDARIAHFGPGGTWNYMLNGHNTFPDLSRGKHALWSVKAGKKHLFRLINSASQNMWSVHFDNHKMTVIATDYVPIKPYTTEWLNIGIGQRYDVIVEMNQPSAGYFLRAVTQTGCPSACVNTGLGQANGIFAYEGAPLTLPTSTAGNVTGAQFAICADEPLASIAPFLEKSAGSSTAFSASASLLPAGAVAQVSTPDDGVVFRWFLNNNALKVDYENPTLQSLATGNNASISNPIVLNKKNEWYYFVIQNQFFASHPMHMHGHDFSVLGQGKTTWTAALTPTLNFVNPARRDTAMLVGRAGGPAGPTPPGYTVIGFQSDNPGAWLMHCHIVWHVDGGLAMQWVERPDDIPAKQYVSKPTFQNQCKNVKNYFAAGGQKITSGESGLKARNYFNDLLNERQDNVVRRGDNMAKRYIDQRLQRNKHF